MRITYKPYEHGDEIDVARIISVAFQGDGSAEVVWIEHFVPPPGSSVAEQTFEQVTTIHKRPDQVESLVQAIKAYSVISGVQQQNTPGGPGLYRH